MRFDKLTIKSQEALAEAQSLGAARGNSEIQPAHLLCALLGQTGGSTVPVLQKLGVPIDALRADLENRIVEIPKVTGAAQPQLSQRLGALLDAAFAEADALQDEYVSTEHLLLAIATVAEFARFLYFHDLMSQAFYLKMGGTRSGSGRLLWDFLRESNLILLAVPILAVAWQLDQLRTDDPLPKKLGKHRDFSAGRTQQGGQLENGDRSHEHVDQPSEEPRPDQGQGHPKKNTPLGESNYAGHLFQSRIHRAHWTRD